MDCNIARLQLDTYVDGELDAAPLIEFEQHLDACADCRGELALARLMKQGVRALPVEAAPEGLKRRVLHALDDEAEGATHGGLAWPRAGVLAAAASVALAIGAAWRTQQPTPSASHAQQDATLAADAAPFGLLGDIVARHTDQLPTDIAAAPPEQITTWFQGKVAFRVRSVEFAEPRVRFVGARVSQIGNQQAAKLYYSVGNSRLTTVVFQPPASLERALADERTLARWGAHRKHFGSRVVTYHSVHGYTVPIFEHDGIAYAFTSDLDQRSLLHLVASARLP